MPKAEHNRIGRMLKIGARLHSRTRLLQPRPREFCQFGIARRSDEETWVIGLPAEALNFWPPASSVASFRSVIEPVSFHARPKTSEPPRRIRKPKSQKARRTDVPALRIHAVLFRHSHRRRRMEFHSIH